MLIKKVILHIGAPKCGSTFIQDFVQKNSSYLSDCGISQIPQNLIGVNGKRWIPTIFRGTTEQCSMPIWNRLGISDCTPAERRKLFSTKLFEIKEWLNSTQIDKFFYSSELISSTLNLDEAKALLRLFEPCKNVKIVYYIRNPLSVSISALSQQARSGQHNCSVLPQPHRRKMLDYKSIIQFWQKLVGSSNVNVRILDKRFLLNNDLTFDFCQSIALPFSENLIQPSQTNSGLSRVELKIMKHLNTWAKNQFNKHELALYKRLRADLMIQGLCPSMPFLPTQGEALAYESYFREDENWLHSFLSLNKSDRLWLYPTHEICDDTRGDYECFATGLSDLEESILTLSRRFVKASICK